MTSLPLSQQLSVFTSLLHHLNLKNPSTDNADTVALEDTNVARSVIKRESLILRETFGDMMSSFGVSQEIDGTTKTVGGQLLIWPLVSAVLDRSFTEGIARVIVCWAVQSMRAESGMFLTGRSMKF